MFGIPGIIIGPIIAALFVTIWDIYGLAFKDVLPDVLMLKPTPAKGDSGEEVLPEKEAAHSTKDEA